MASHAESAVARAMRALVERDDALGLQVQADDNILDQMRSRSTTPRSICWPKHRSPPNCGSSRWR